MSAVIEAPSDAFFAGTTILPAPLPGRPQMGIYATRKQIFADGDPALYYHFPELDCRKLDDFTPVCSSSPAFSSRCFVYVFCLM